VLIAPPPFVDIQEPGAPLERLIEFDPILQTRYRPNTTTKVHSQYGEFDVRYHTNELGLRERPLHDLPTGHRVLVLGNSFVEGWGVEVEDSFVRVAERQINTDIPSSPTALINAGMSGYGVAQSYLLGRELLARVRPDAIVLVYASTMVQADHRYLALADLDSRGIATGLNPDSLANPTTGGARDAPAAVPGRLLRFAAEYSAVVRMFVLRQMAEAAQRAILPGDPASDLLAGLRADKSQLPALHDPSLQHVIALARVAGDAGLPFILVHVPLPHQLSAYEWSLGRTAYGLEARVYPTADVDVVKAYCESHGLQCVFAHEAMRASIEQSGDERLYYTYDFHPNASGNRALGAWLARQLENFLPAVAGTR
jgi:lysophospholipase L1-like esterase